MSQHVDKCPICDKFKMILKLILFFISMNFCINHPNLACFAIPSINRESKWKNKESEWISSY